MLAKPKVLVVDDEAPIRDLCTRILGRAHEVAVAGDGPSAITIARSFRPDILLTDLRMPGMSGLEAARQIVADVPDVSVLVMTGFSEFDSLLETVRFGVHGFLLKPFTPDDLRKTVEDGLRKGQYFKRNARLRLLAPLLDLRSGSLADLDPHRVFQTISETALHELNADRVTLVCLDEDGKEVAVTASATPGGQSPVTTTSTPGGNGQLQDAARDLATRDGAGQTAEENGGVLSIPLQAGGNLVGVLTAVRQDAPFGSEDRDTLRLICAQGAIAIENIRLFKQLRRSYWNTVYALAATVDLRDHPTRGHSDRLAQYAASIGARLGLVPDRLEDLKIAALLHDIGKIGIGDGILRKPGDLTAEEYDWMKTHTLMGAKILAMADFSPRVVEAVLFHHERCDGSGYPLGLAGDQIPIEARILTTADALESMTSTRSYREAMPLDAAVAELVKGRGTQFDPQVVDALMACLEAGELQPYLASAENSIVDSAAS